MANVRSFSEKFGVEVRVDHESWEDVRPKAAVAANVGSGPDIILSTNDDANLYPDKLVDVTDLANYLGKKYGGWYPVCEQYLKPDGKSGSASPWAAGNAIVYRESQVKAAGFSTSQDQRRLPQADEALKDKGTPGGFALGHATGDQSWAFWLVWAFGGKMVDANNKVVINSPETVKALEYGKELYATFVPGTLSWLDPNNNKAFLDGQVGVTRTASRSTTRRRTQDAKVKEMAADIQHANFPVGPAGQTEFNLFFNQMVMKHTASTRRRRRSSCAS